MNAWTWAAKRLNPPPRARRWLYRVALAAGAIAVAYGVMDGEQAAVWTGLVLALTGGTASGNVNDPDAS